MVVGWNPVSDPAAVVAPGRLLHALEDEHVGVVDTGQQVPGPRVVVPIQFQNFTLKQKKIKN